MKNILFFGDSNTFGWNPVTQRRFSPEKRWTNIVAKKLGQDYHVIEEGLSGRTTVFQCDDVPTDRGRNGEFYFFPCLQSHKPLDLIVIMLGTNDTKLRYNADAKAIAKGLEALVKIATDSDNYEKHPAKLLIISPILITKAIKKNFGGIYDEFGNGIIEKSEQLSAEYKALAEKHSCFFMDAADYTSPSEIDGVHLDEKGAEKLAVAIEEKILQILQ